MPVDLEMILSASPPIFSSAGFMDFRYNNHFDGPRNHFNKFSSAVHGLSYKKNGEARPCLAGKSEDHRENNKSKRVWFADDKGLALTHVKVMSEPSNCPPRWTDDFLEQITKGIKPHPSSDIRWEPMFAQPASDYLEFRSKLQRNCVSLENVIIREGEDSFSGTIKVKNLSFDKEVFVRVTFDRWHSSEDVPASYVSSGVDGGSSQYDTFSFSVTIPNSAVKFETIEFCVCFRCSGAEYWDNNGGSNYKLVVFGNKPKPVDHHVRRFNDALKVNLDSWSEFSSWSHLITEGPYW